MSDVARFRIAERSVDEDVLALAEEVVERVKAGETVSLAVVEVHPAGNVSWRRVTERNYHALNSGCARLAAAMASEQD